MSTMGTTQASSDESNDVIFETLNNAGVIILNRPRKLNCLTDSMLSRIQEKLQEWERSRALVIVKGAGGRAFCSGGDLTRASHKLLGPKYFRVEFTLVHYISKYRLPYVALLDGIAMGGGLGLALHGKYRVATERTLVAMPENKVGLFVDVGGTHFFPRLHSNLGYMLGLTGDSLKGKDAVSAGIATHYIPSARLFELETLLSRCASEAEACALLGALCEPPGEQFSLAPHMSSIKYCFAAGSIEEIEERLQRADSPWAAATLQTLRSVCPGSLKITLRAMQRGAQLDLAQCLRMEFRLATRCVHNHDFPEGVRALLIDKDNKPQWSPRSLADVTDEYVEAHFRKLPEDDELKFTDSKL